MQEKVYLPLCVCVFLKYRKGKIESLRTVQKTCQKSETMEEAQREWVRRSSKNIKESTERDGGDKEANVQERERGSE